LTFHWLEALSPAKSEIGIAKMTIQLTIDGMHCAGCVNAVRKVLEAVPSVTAVSVNLDAGRATVEASPTVDATKLKEAVEDAGYGAGVVA
jgi:P-type Cu+ transporter